jgi:hypothetical protein
MTASRSITFSFDSNRLSSNASSVPMFSFTSAAFRQKSFPPHLKFCQAFLENFLQTFSDARRLLWLSPRPDSAPDYDRTVKSKMDFATISRNVQGRVYRDFSAFKADVDLVWQNYIDYIAPDSEAARKCQHWRFEFDTLWTLHTGIRDPEAAVRLLKASDEVRRLLEEDLREGGPGMEIFAPLLDRPRILVGSGHGSRSVHSERPPERSRGERWSFRLPPPEVLNRPMTIEERYDLAMTVDNLPIELLGEVVEILVRAKGIKRDEGIDIAFRDLETTTLRTLEACVKDAKAREVDVKKKRMNESQLVSAEQKLEALQIEKGKIEKRLRDKHPEAPSGDATSDAHTSDDGTVASSGNDGEESSE